MAAFVIEVRKSSVSIRPFYVADFDAYLKRVGAKDVAVQDVSLLYKYTLPVYNVSIN